MNKVDELLRELENVMRESTSVEELRKASLEAEQARKKLLEKEAASNEGYLDLLKTRNDREEEDFKHLREYRDKLLSERRRFHDEVTQSIREGFDKVSKALGDNK